MDEFKPTHVLRQYSFFHKDRYHDTPVVCVDKETWEPCKKNCEIVDGLNTCKGGCNCRIWDETGKESIYYFKNGDLWAACNCNDARHVSIRRI